MQMLTRFSLIVLPVFGWLASPQTADAGRLWYWGHPGYADTSYYAPSWGFASYAPAYYGPAAGCCGSACSSGGCGFGGCSSGGCTSGGCQMSFFAPGCGCDPCGCSSCGCDSCGVACAGGSCSGGNCGMNAAPANAAPIPDPNLNATPIAPRNNSGGADAPPPSTFEGDDAPRYEPPSRTRAPVNDPMADPMRDLGDPMFPPPRSRDLAPPSRTAPPAGGVDPLDDGFRSRPLPSRTPAPGTNPLDAPLDPASADPATGFSAGKAVVPEDGSVISTPAPADSAPIRDDAAPASDTSTEDQEQGTSNEAGPNLPAPSEGPQLDLSVTTRPVIVKARLTLQGRGSSMLHAERPRDDRQWSAIPAPLSVARQ